MKVLKTPDADHAKRISILVDNQPELIEMLRRENARMAAKKTTQRILLALFAITVVGCVLYVLPLVNQLVIIINNSPVQ